MESPQFRRITSGIETLPAKFRLPRHRHLRGYATVVLAGRFEESGYLGRLCASAGDVLIHPALDCHANEMVSAGVKLIRLHWSDAHSPGGLYGVEEVDALARAAEKDPRVAAVLLRELLKITSASCTWTKKRLAGHIGGGVGSRAIDQDWSLGSGQRLESGTVSRGFGSAYGVTPKLFRAELRTE